MAILSVFVPRGGSSIAGHVATSSAIVGHPGDTRNVTVHYEGNIHGASNLDTFHAKTMVAAGRSVMRYPTIAVMSVDREDLIEVARYDAVRHAFVDLIDSALLSKWAGEPINVIVGEKRVPGLHELAGASELVNQLVFLGHRSNGGMIYKSRAGQIVIAPAVPRTDAFLVYDHDDPNIVEELKGVLFDQKLAYAIGEDTTATRTAVP